MKTIKQIEQSKSYGIGLLILCLIIRVTTHINYIEDIDSMRFALGVQDYDVANYQPHFPAYPVYCFLTKVFYSISGNLGISFSVLGGIASFLIVFYTPQLLSDRNNILFSLFLLVNPLLWLLANRFMPDLLGLGLAITSLFYFKNWYLKGDQKSLAYSVFLIAMLAGVRLSYMPLLLLPIVIMFLKGGDYKIIFGVGLLGIAIWLIPLIIDTGWSNLITVAQAQTNGHFNEFGGTVINEPGIVKRLSAIFIYTWSDGLGGWMPDRYWITLIVSFLIIVPLATSLIALFKPVSSYYKILIGSVFIYFVWALFFQNVLYKSRHILPLIPFAIIAYYHGLKILLRTSNPRSFYLVLTIVATSVVSVPLVLQHKRPSAIEKCSRYLNSIDQKTIVIGPKLIEKRVSLIGNSKLKFCRDNYVCANGDQILSFTKKNNNGYRYVGDTTFYHNPYVNRMWPVVSLYKYLPTNE